MSSIEKSGTLKERLCKLEDELDELLKLQEKIRHQAKTNQCSSGTVEQREHSDLQGCPCVNVTSCTRTRTLISKGQVVAPCAQFGSAPLTDISKFLQHINFNLTKGTQAINKIANSASQHKPEDAEKNKPFHGTCLEKDENVCEFPTVWKLPVGKKLDENALFKELREEKDRRVRAENQLKSLKDETKKIKSEVQQKADSTIHLLRMELKDTSEKLQVAKEQLNRHKQECSVAEYIWPLKYETVCKDLQEERLKRDRAEKDVHELQEMLQRQYFTTQEHLALQKSSNWLKDQNQHLISLVKNLQKEIDDMSGEVSKKSQAIDDGLRKIKQLTGVCEQLRDYLIVTRAKAAAAEDKLTHNLTHCQRLADKLLEVQSNSEELKRCQIQDRLEQKRLSDHLSNANNMKEDLQTRVEEMSDILKQQNELIARQADTISNKEQHLKLAYGNMKLQSQRLDELEKRTQSTPEDVKARQMLQNDVNRLMLDLENEKENVLIKGKMVDSHLQSIARLRITLAGKEEEMNVHKRELNESERKLVMERNTNEQLLSKIKLLQSRKEELQLKLEMLEEELEAQLSTEHTKRLEQIEKQVRNKQREWEEQKLKLIEEKEEALQSLRFTIQKLQDESADQQLQLVTQQQVADNLNTLLKEKEDQLQEAMTKISCLKSELLEVKECAEKTKNRFEEKLHNACELWQKTMQQLQN